MKLGDMTFKQIVEKVCRDKTCDECPFYDPDKPNKECPLTCVDPEDQNLDVEVSTDAENQS